MKAMRSAGLGLLALLLGAGAASAQNGYLGLQAGDRLTLSDQTQVTAQGPQSGTNWRLWSDFLGLGPVWVWPSTQTQRAWVWTSAAGTQELADLAAMGSAKTVVMGTQRGRVVVAATETVTVPAGTFRGCIRLDMTGFFNKAGEEVESVWLADGVNVVKVQTSARAIELVSAEVGGVTYPQALGGMSVGVTFPHRDKWFNMMPSPTPRPTPTIEIGIRVRNDGTQDETIHFQPGSPSHFTVKIEDAQGNVIIHKRPLTRAAIMPRVMRPGDEVTERVTIELVDPNGALLRQGDYTIRVNVGYTYESTAPMTVSYAF